MWRVTVKNTTDWKQLVNEFDIHAEDLAVSTEWLTATVLKQIRKDLSVSQQWFTEVICGYGIDRTTITGFEKLGKRPNTSTRILIILGLKHRLKDKV